MKFLLAAIPFLLLCASTSAQDAAVETRWSAVLRTTPFHVGDTTHKEMRNPKPDGDKFTASFDLPKSIPVGFGRSFRVEIDVTHLMPSGDKRHRNGKFLARLFVNGREQAVLNKYAHGRESQETVNNLAIELPGEVFKTGRNEIQIVPGGAQKDFDDFELQRVAVSTLRPPK